jgi:hypothetical protein
MRPAKRAATLSIVTTLGLMLTLALPAPAALAQAGTWTKLLAVPSLGQGVEGMAVGVINGKIIPGRSWATRRPRGSTIRPRIRGK